MNATSAQSVSKSRRRWLQFTMRGLIVLMIIAAIGAFWLRSEVQRAREQRLAVELIEELGGSVNYHYEIGEDPLRPLTNPVPPGPAWLNDLLGENIFLKIAVLQRNNAYMSEDQLELLEPLDNLTVLAISGGQPAEVEFTDKSARHLADMSELEMLLLSGTQITNAGLVQIRNLTKLEVLDLPIQSLMKRGYGISAAVTNSRKSFSFRRNSRMRA